MRENCVPWPKRCALSGKMQHLIFSPVYLPYEGIDEGSRVVAVDIVKNEDGRLPRVCGLLPGPGYEVLGGRATRSTLGT